MSEVLEPFLTEDDVAAYLKVSKRTVQNWRLTGNGPVFVKFGRAVRYDKKEIDRWIASNCKKSTYDKS